MKWVISEGEDAVALSEVGAGAGAGAGHIRYLLKILICYTNIKISIK